MVTPIDPASLGFILSESKNQPMHVGGLHLFEPPEDAGPDYVHELFEAAIEYDEPAPLFAKRPHRSITTAGQWVWTRDEQFDIEHHVRHNALPKPGRIRELLELTSRLHSQKLDFERPLWETHMIEGLADGRFATYSKLHHALVDGVSAMRLLQATYSPDPDQRDMRPPWAKKERPPRERGGVEPVEMAKSLAEMPADAVRTALGVASEAAGLPGALVRTLRAGLRNETAAVSFNAPRTILNQRITGARRIAAQDWPLDRIKGVGKASGATLNDVVLAMCAGALRSYLLEQNALPDNPLVSMVPIGLRAKQSQVASAEGGNAVGAVMVNLATDLADPAARLSSIQQSMVQGKRALSSMTQPQIIAMAALGVSPLLLQQTPLQSVLRPPFNVVISNVPGPRKPLYYNGARLTGMYPISVPTHGQGLNITCTSYVDQLAFGLTGCRRTVPHLQRLLTHLDDELAALEKAVGV